MTKDFKKLPPRELRLALRNNELEGETAGMAPGYLQTGLITFPKEYAYDFLLFAQRNPKPCPIFDVTDPGGYEPKFFAPGADLRTDLGKYMVYKNGELIDTPRDVVKYWRDDLVSCLVGCSYTFEGALKRAGFKITHEETQSIVSIFKTNIPCNPTNLIQGPLVVSMRPFHYSKIPRVVQITSRYPASHGAPVHIGDPSLIGIKDISKPDFGDPTEFKPGEVPVFWACGLTTHVAMSGIKPEIVIAQYPGYMFVTDINEEDLAAL